MVEQHVKREKLSEVVIAAIKAYVIDHALSEGDRLPTEHQMAKLFGVSRISVREATKALGFLGIIRSAPKRGLTIGHVDMQRITEYLDFHFALNKYPKELLLKTRVIIETGILPDVMERIAADPQLYNRLLSINDKIRKAKNTSTFIQGDLAFHRALIEASGIEPLVAFSGLLEIFFRQFKKKVAEVRKQWANGIDVHAKILKSLQARDLEKARQLLRLHLSHYEGHL